MITRLFGLLLVVCISFQLSAQTDQFIVKFNGDTIRGKLHINPARDNSKSMQFKDEDGSRETVRPIRISYVYYDQDIQFRSVPFFNQRLFMQIIEEAENISYYNYIHKRDNSIATSKVITKPTGESLELSALTFKKQVSQFLDDCPEIVEKLEAREYRYKNHQQLFEDYNNCDEKLAITSTAETPSTAAAETTSTTNSTLTTPPTATNETAASSSLEKNSGDPLDDKHQAMLTEIESFREYLTGLEDFQYTDDVLEWLSDVENRITTNQDIPNYLWSSLNAMTSGYQELKEKAEYLQKALSL